MLKKKFEDLVNNRKIILKILKFLSVLSNIEFHITHSNYILIAIVRVNWFTNIATKLLSEKLILHAINYIKQTSKIKVSLGSILQRLNQSY